MVMVLKYFHKTQKGAGNPPPFGGPGTPGPSALILAQKPLSRQ